MAAENLAPWMELVARYGGDPATAREAVVQSRGAVVAVGRRNRNGGLRAVVGTGIPDWVTWGTTRVLGGAGPVFEVREPTAFESVLELVGLLREVTLEDETIDPACVVRAADVEALRRAWTPDARNLFKRILRTHAASVHSDGKVIQIDVVEPTADLPLLVAMVELLAELAGC